MLIKGLSSLISEHDLTGVLTVSGHPSWSFLNIKGTNSVTFDVIQTYFLQEFFRKGILCLGTHNISHAHSIEDIDTLLNVYCEIFKKLKLALQQSDLISKLECEVLKPLFSVRKSATQFFEKETV
jgi:glutamate-1-semialdehyde 2,1-aminomutase